MMPITDFLSCTRVFNEFESLSPAQRQHAKSFQRETNALSTSSSPSTTGTDSNLTTNASKNSNALLAEIVDTDPRTDLEW